MDPATLAAYARGAASYAEDWHAQPPPSDLHDILRRFFVPGGISVDVGCGSGREVGWLVDAGFVASGIDASPELLVEARQRYPQCRFERGELPGLSGLAPESFDNVLCETVIMHLPEQAIDASVRRLVDILRPGGVLYLSWRVTPGGARDEAGRLYTDVDAASVRIALGPVVLLLDQQVTSASSGKTIHRLVARKS